MKFLVVFVHEEDADAAADALRSTEIRFTSVSSTSGFLRHPSKTFLIGIEEGRVDECLGIFEAHCETRIVGAPGSALEGAIVDVEEYSEKYRPATVEVGGAVGFVLDAARVL